MVIRRTDLYNEDAPNSNVLTQEPWNIINLSSPSSPPLTPDDNNVEMPFSVTNVVLRGLDLAMSARSAGTDPGNKPRLKT